MTEELTTEERAYLDGFDSGMWPVWAKLLRLYYAALAQSKADREWCAEMTRLNDLRGQERDAALARAKKAEQNMNAIGESWRKPCERAESALAEATALLGKCLNMVGPDFREVLRAFLSRTLAPAAKAEPDKFGFFCISDNERSRQYADEFTSHQAAEIWLQRHCANLSDEQYSLHRSAYEIRPLRPQEPLDNSKVTQSEWQKLTTLLERIEAELAVGEHDSGVCAYALGALKLIRASKAGGA